MEIYRSLPNFVGEAGPPDVDGVGNYRLPIHSADPSNTNIFNMYFLDSHASITHWFSQKSEYEPLTKAQIEWFRSQSDQVDPILRPYKPADLSAEEGAFGLEDDLTGRVVRRLRTRQALEQTLRKPNAMAWFHIPGRPLSC